MTSKVAKSEVNSKTIISIQNNINSLHELLKKIVDNSAKRIIILSDNKVVYGNNRALSELGYNRKEFNNIAMSDVFVSPQGSDFLVKYLGVELSLKVKTTELESLSVIRRNGEVRRYKPSIKRCFWKGKASILMVLNDSNGSSYNTAESSDSSSKRDMSVSMPSLFVWDYQIETGGFKIDKKFFDLLNLKPRTSEYRIDDWIGALNPDSKKEFNRIITNIRINKQQQQQWEYEVVDRSNRLHTVLANFEVVGWDTHGNPDHIIGLHTFIDPQTRKNFKGNGHGGSLKGFIENTLDGLLVIDRNGVVQEWNPALERLTLIKREQAVGNYLWVLQHNLSPDQRPLGDFINDLSDVFADISQKGKNALEGQLFESKIKLSNGTLKVVQHSIFTIDSPTGMLVAISNRDITESRLNQDKVEKSEERLKLALAASNMGIWDIDFVTNERYFSPMVFAILGYRPLEVDITGELGQKHLHPEDFDLVKQKVMALLASGTNLDLEARVIRKDGKVIWVQSKTRLIRDERNKLLRITGTVSDITRQKAIETELRKSEEDLKKNLQQHEVVSNISYALNTNHPFPDKIQQTLKMLGNFTQASRVYIFQNDVSQQVTSNTYEWCNDGIESQIQTLQQVPIGMIEDWAGDREYMMSRNLNVDLPQEFAAMMIEQDIESFIIFRLQVGGKPFGYIGFDECGNRRIWTKTEIELLKTISSLISFAFERELKRKEDRS